eukprot:scaffold536089_cov75-Attheya_sp.AAC.1
MAMTGHPIIIEIVEAVHPIIDFEPYYDPIGNGMVIPAQAREIQLALGPMSMLLSRNGPPISIIGQT